MADENGGAIASAPAAAPTPAPAASPTPAPAPAAPVTVGPAPPAAASPTPSPTPATLAASDPAATPVAAPATWPENWRQLMAGDDKTRLKQLERMAAPPDVFKSLAELQAKFSSGQFKTPLAADATPEQLKAWRTENGIPDDPAGYKPELPNGIVPGEADKPLLDGFAKFVHGKNWTPTQFNEALSWYYSTQDQIEAQKAQEDAAYHAQAEDTLRKEWGGEYRGNINAVKSLFANAPNGLFDQLMTGRLGNGRIIGDDPQALGFLTALAREMNPAATLLPPGSANPSAGLDAEIKQIETDMRTNRDAYFKDPAKQARYGELLAAREKMAARK